MVEVLVWLLLFHPTDSRASAQVLERFKTQQQCEHVAKFFKEGSGKEHRYGCIQANILVPR